MAMRFLLSPCMLWAGLGGELAALLSIGGRANDLVFKDGGVLRADDLG